MNDLFRSHIFRRFWDVAGAASIRVKVLGIVLGTVLLLGAFVIVQMRTVLTNTLIEELDRQGMALSESVAHHSADLISAGAADSLSAYLADRQDHYSSSAHNTQVAFVRIVDSNGQIVADAQAGAATGRAVPAEGGVSLSAESRLLQNGRVLLISTAIPDSSWILQLGLGTGNIRYTVNTVTFQLLLITLIMLIVGLAAAFFLTWILTRPILDLVEATQAIGRGDFSRRVSRWANDEIGELASAFNAMAASLQEAEQERAEREQLREQYVSGVILAQENERQRIARELHDSTSQSLTSLLVGLQNLKLTHNDGELDHRSDELRAIVIQTLDEVRAIAWRLRPSALDDLGLLSALQHYIEDYQKRYGLHVDFITSGLEDRLPQELETTIYRIVQEGLTNVARHAQANRAGVVISRRHGLIRLIIEDNGIGFNPDVVQGQQRSLGIQGIRERAGLFGGRLMVESQPGQGASLFVEIPVQPAIAEEGKVELWQTGHGS